MTTAVVASRPRVIPAPTETAKPYADPRVIRLELRLERERRRSALSAQWSQIAADFLRQPIPLAVGGILATNLLSQVKTGEYFGSPTYALTGAQAVALQTAILTPTFLNTLADATRTGFDIASLIKLIGAI